MSEQHKPFSPLEVVAAAMTLMIEMGYTDDDGYLTPLGEQYIDALYQAGEVAIIDAPLPPPPMAPNFPEGGASGGMNWSDIPDF